MCRWYRTPWCAHTPRISAQASIQFYHALCGTAEFVTNWTTTRRSIPKQSQPARPKAKARDSQLHQTSLAHTLSSTDLQVRGSCTPRQQHGARGGGNRLWDMGSKA